MPGPMNPMLWHLIQTQQGIQQRAKDEAKKFNTLAPSLVSTPAGGMDVKQVSGFFDSMSSEIDPKDAESIDTLKNLRSQLLGQMQEIGKFQVDLGLPEGYFARMRERRRRAMDPGRVDRARYKIEEFKTNTLNNLADKVLRVEGLMRGLGEDPLIEAAKESFGTGFGKYAASVFEQEDRRRFIENSNMSDEDKAAALRELQGLQPIPGIADKLEELRNLSTLKQKYKVPDDVIREHAPQLYGAYQRIPVEGKSELDDLVPNPVQAATAMRDLAGKLFNASKEDVPTGELKANGDPVTKTVYRLTLQEAFNQARSVLASASPAWAKAVNAEYSPGGEEEFDVDAEIINILNEVEAEGASPE